MLLVGLLGRPSRSVLHADLQGVGAGGHARDGDRSGRLVVSLRPAVVAHGDGDRRGAATQVHLHDRGRRALDLPAANHGRRVGFLLPGRDLDVLAAVDHHQLRVERGLGAYHVDAGVERHLARERDEQVLDADVDGEILALVGVVEAGALHIEALEGLVRAEELQDLRRGVVRVEVDDDGAQAEADAAVPVGGDRRLHTHELAGGEGARRVEPAATPRRQVERGRALEVVGLLVGHDDLGQHDPARPGDALVLHDAVVGVELARPPVVAELEVDLVEQQLEAEAHAGVFARGGGGLVDGQEGVEQRAQLGERRGG